MRVGGIGPHKRAGAPVQKDHAQMALPPLEGGAMRGVPDPAFDLLLRSEVEKLLRNRAYLYDSPEDYLAGVSEAMQAVRRHPSLASLKAADQQSIAEAKRLISRAEN